MMFVKGLIATYMLLMATELVGQASGMPAHFPDEAPEQAVEIEAQGFLHSTVVGAGIGNRLILAQYIPRGRRESAWLRISGFARAGVEARGQLEATVFIKQQPFRFAIGESVVAGAKITGDGFGLLFLGNAWAEEEHIQLDGSRAQRWHDRYAQVIWHGATDTSRVDWALGLRFHRLESYDELHIPTGSLFTAKDGAWLDLTSAHRLRYASMPGTGFSVVGYARGRLGRQSKVRWRLGVENLGLAMMPALQTHRGDGMTTRFQGLQGSKLFASSGALAFDLAEADSLLGTQKKESNEVMALPAHITFTLSKEYKAWRWDVTWHYRAISMGYFAMATRIGYVGRTQGGGDYFLGGMVWAGGFGSLSIGPELAYRKGASSISLSLPGLSGMLAPTILNGTGGHLRWRRNF